MPQSELLRALAALSEARVDFVIVGVAGINFYLPAAESPMATVDVDVLVRAEVENLRRALGALEAAGFALEAGGEPFADVADDLVLSRLVASGGAVRAHGGGVDVDIMLAMTGFDFDSITSDAVSFVVGGHRLRAGQLEKLLRAKELAGRPKDVEFLRAFAARFGALVPRGRGRRKRRKRKTRRR